MNRFLRGTFVGLAILLSLSVAVVVTGGFYLYHSWVPSPYTSVSLSKIHVRTFPTILFPRSLQKTHPEHIHVELFQYTENASESPVVLSGFSAPYSLYTSNDGVDVTAKIGVSLGFSTSVLEHI